MEKQFKLVFDEVMLAQLKKLGGDKHLRGLLSKMFDKMEALGPRAGKLIDTQLFLYEIKLKHPPLRLYYKPVAQTGELYVFEYEMKTGENKQQRTIKKLQEKAKQKFQKLKSPNQP